MFGDRTEAQMSGYIRCDLNTINGYLPSKSPSSSAPRIALSTAVVISCDEEYGAHTFKIALDIERPRNRSECICSANAPNKGSKHHARAVMSRHVLGFFDSDLNIWR